MRHSSYLFLTMLAGALTLLSCSRETEAPEFRDDAGTFRMELRGGVVPFDAGTTKADVYGNFEYSSSNLMYLRLTEPGKTVLAQASYNTDLGSWDIRLSTGTLDGLSSGTVEAYLFEDNWSTQSANSSNFNNDVLGLSYRTPVYVSQAGASYQVDGNVLTVEATFIPLTGRITFTEDIEDGYSRDVHDVGGLRYFTGFDIRNWTFITSDQEFYYGTMDKRSFIYGSFNSSICPVLTYRPNSDVDILVKHFPADIFQQGQSGSITLPRSYDDADGWQRDHLYHEFYAQYRWFRLYYVGLGGFLMGGDDAGPIHEASFSHGFYMMQSEVPQGLWEYAMQNGEYGYNDIAVTGKSYAEIQTFIQKLNERVVYYTFRLPTEAEWEFAARGGRHIQDYRYSGSNYLPDVAYTQDRQDWSEDSPFVYYSYQLYANILNIQDLSGNAAELCSDWYGDYPSNPVLDPKGPAEGSYHVVRGGSAFSKPEWMTCTHRGSEADYDPSQVGFRLVVEANPLND